MRARANSQSGTPQIGTNGPPTIGYSGWQITGSNLIPNGASAVIVSALQATIPHTAFGGIPLPFALPNGCQLLVAPNLVLVRTTDPAGYATVSTPIPPDKNA